MTQLQLGSRFSSSPSELCSHPSRLLDAEQGRSSRTQSHLQASRPRRCGYTCSLSAGGPPDLGELSFQAASRHTIRAEATQEFECDVLRFSSTACPSVCRHIAGVCARRLVRGPRSSGSSRSNRLSKLLNPTARLVWYQAPCKVKRRHHV